MTTSTLGTALASLAALVSLAAPAAGADAKHSTRDDHQPAMRHDVGRGTYCTSPSIQNMYPTCAPPPAATKDYRGEPIAVWDDKRFDPGTMRGTVNVLKNDAIQKKHAIRMIKVTYQRPAKYGIRTWLVKDRVHFEVLPGRAPDGRAVAEIRYKVVDFKGRSSKETNVYIRIDHKGCVLRGTCR